MSDVGNDGDAEVGGKEEAGGPVDEEGAAYEVVSWYDAGGVLGVAIAESGLGPEAGVVAGGAVVAEDEEFVRAEGEGSGFFGGASGSAVGDVGVVGVAEELE